MDSCFALIGARQHCVAKICNASTMACTMLGTGHAVKCLGWLCPATFIFLLFETPIVTLWSPCALKHVMWQRVFLGASEFKVRNLIWNGSFCNLCA